MRGKDRGTSQAEAYMKNDLDLTVNKIISYAFDNLLLDSLDEVYTLNRIAAACGVKSIKRDEDADYGDATLGELLDELPDGADKDAVAAAVFPLPRTINAYFGDALDRGKKKAFEFLFELYGYGRNILSKSPALGADGFLGYYGDAQSAPYGVWLDDLSYTPRVLGNHIASLDKPDVMLDDILAREAAYVSNYGGTVATRVGDKEYLCCDASALTVAPVKKTLSDGPVNVSVLDYPVPALAFNGIAKNAVIREVKRIADGAAAAGYAVTVAAAEKNGVTFYLVFSGEGKKDEGNILRDFDALTACGVFKTADCTPVLSVLEKGTALSTDLAPYKAVYDIAGGVKHGAKAPAALGDALVRIFKPVFALSASADEESVVALFNAPRE